MLPRALILAALVLLPACARTPRPDSGAVLLPEDPAAARIPAGQYAAAFDAARHALRDAGFTLERVDAWSGVITTWPNTSAGIVTPWSRDQSTIAQEFGDFLHRHRRVARITFEPAPPTPAAGDPGAPADLRTLDADLIMRVRVTVERAYQPGWRIDTTSIRNSSYAVDPALQARAMQPVYAVAREEDRLLAERLAARIAAN